MNERFLSKAKALFNNKWVTGYYYRETSTQLHYINQNGIAVLINTETLCACTGLKTEDGTLVFEGDYFWHENDEGIIGVVNYDYDDVRLNVRLIPNTLSGGCVPDFDTTLEWWELDEYDFIPQIIGNIHDKKVQE